MPESESTGTVLFDSPRIPANIPQAALPALRAPGHADSSAVMDEAVAQLDGGFEEVYFYVAGFIDKPPVNLGDWFPGASIECASDMLGAARAVCQHRPGIAAILGTGANTCQWDGKKIVRRRKTEG